MGDSALRDQTRPRLIEAMHARTEVLAAIIVPARLDSTRFPGKALASRTGRPLFAHTIDAALRAQHATDVGLVTDSRRVHEEAGKLFGGKALPLYSERKAECGTNRAAHWLDHFEGWETYDVVVNLQCDEPCIDPRDLDNLIMACALSDQVSTLVSPFGSTQRGRANRADVNCVKAWKRGDRIHDFSRAYPCSNARGAAWQHVGAYAFPKKLFELMEHCPTSRAKQHSLEQLTWLDKGHKLFAVECKFTAEIISVNTPADYQKFVRWVEQQRECEQAQ